MLSSFDSSQEQPVQVGSVDGHVTVGAHRALVEARCADGRKAEVELRDHRVAAITQLAYLVMRQQVSIRAAMRYVTGGAPVDARGGMLEDEWPIGICVALGTHCLLETSQARSAARRMRVVTRGAGDCAFGQSVSFVERKFAERLLVAFEAHR
jgi:hypothetical protein